MVSEQPSEAHGALIADARFLDGEKTLLTIDHQKDVKLWDVATGALKASFSFGPSLAVNAISLTADEKWLAIASKSGRAVLMSLEDGKIAWELSNGTGFIDVDFHPDEKTLLISDDVGLAVYDRPTGKQVRRFGPRPKDQQRLMAAFLSPEQILTISLYGELTTWNWKTGQVEEVILSRFLSDYMAEWRIISGRESRVVVTQFKGPPIVVNLATREAVPLDTGNWRVVTGWDIAGPQQKLLTPYAVFDFPGGGVVGRTGISGYEDVRVSPTGTHLVVMSLRIWRLHRLPKSFDTGPN